MDSKTLAKKIMSIELERPNGELGDNIAVMLASYLSESVDNPHDGEMDEHDCWEQWVVDRVDEFEAAIASVIQQAIDPEIDPRRTPPPGRRKKVSLGSHLVFPVENRYLYLHDFNVSRGIPAGVAFNWKRSGGYIQLSAEGYGGTDYGNGPILVSEDELEGYSFA